MLAVKAVNIRAVEFLLAFDHPVTAASLATRDSDGSLPLHMAVTKGYVEITKLLLGASPRSLFVEDGLGSTSLEQARLRYMLWLSNNGLGTQNVVPPRWAALSTQFPRLEDNEIDKLFSSSWIRQLFNSIPEYGKITASEVRDLEATVQYLEEEGRFLRQPAVKQVLDEYVQRCHAAATKWAAFEALKQEVKDAEAKEYVPVSTVMETVKLDLQDAKATYETVRDAVAASGTRNRRELVHLLDAQRAVDTSLKAATKRGGDAQFQFPGGYSQQYRRPDDLDLTPEKKDEMAFRYALNLYYHPPAYSAHNALVFNIFA
jgi:Ankyrin repeat